MIILSEVANKLNEILNDANAPIDLAFIVRTPGFHLDQVADQQTKKNYIPVFISSLGGNINPVPLLKQVDATIPMTFYFPVRFKEKFFVLNEYLIDELVGQFLEWGAYSGKAISNLSLPRYGEIQDLDLKAFKDWTQENFDLSIEVMEPYMSMELTLYLSTSNPEFIYGNIVKVTGITIYHGSTKILEDTNPICIDRADIGSSEPAVQQCFSDKYTKGFGANAAYTKQLPLIVKNTEGYYDLLDICENEKDIQNLEIDLEEEIPVEKEFTETINGESVTVKKKLTVTNHYFITNYSRRTTIGQLLGISFTLATSRQEEEEEE